MVRKYPEIDMRNGSLEGEPAVKYVVFSSYSLIFKQQPPPRSQIMLVAREKLSVEVLLNQEGW
jgi:hypothetical protein